MPDSGKRSVTNSGFHARDDVVAQNELMIERDQHMGGRHRDQGMGEQFVDLAELVGDVAIALERRGYLEQAEIERPPAPQERRQADERHGDHQEIKHAVAGGRRALEHPPHAGGIGRLGTGDPQHDARNDQGQQDEAENGVEIDDRRPQRLVEQVDAQADRIEADDQQRHQPMEQDDRRSVILCFDGGGHGRLLRANWPWAWRRECDSKEIGK